MSFSTKCDKKDRWPAYWDGNISCEYYSTCLIMLFNDNAVAGLLSYCWKYKDVVKSTRLTSISSGGKDICIFLFSFYLDSIIQM